MIAINIKENGKMIKKKNMEYIIIIMEDMKKIYKFFINKYSYSFIF